jgi:hypothetical protein
MKLCDDVFVHQNKGHILSYLRPVNKTDNIVVLLQDSTSLAEFEVVKSLTCARCQFVGLNFRAVRAATFGDCLTRFRFSPEKLFTF